MKEVLEQTLSDYLLGKTGGNLGEDYSTNSFSIKSILKDYQRNKIEQDIKEFYEEQDYEYSSRASDLEL